MLLPGHFSKNLAALITKTLVQAARLDGKIGGTVQRNGDSPERHGIPAKQFSVIAESEKELHVEMAKYQPDNVRVICVMDDTLAKGVESWAWYGVQPIHINLQPGGTVLFISHRTPQELLQFVPRKPFDWKIAILDGDPCFAGLWVYKDDGIDYRTIGAVAHIEPTLVSIHALREHVSKLPDAERKLQALEAGYARVRIYPVQAGEGAEDTYVPVEKPGWTEMREGLVIPAVPMGQNNELFKKYTTRTQRPVIRFDTCIKCEQCYIECPDECFEIAGDGYFIVNYEHCCGCGICSEICPVEGCITMVDELRFESNEDLHELYVQDPQLYNDYISEKLEAVR
ncbi:MAG: (4Fe-4S)-binding protein [Firmicutes bacterium]|nr:(4Fe-4S)-binding protein [Bacillota bacterium]